MTGLLAALAAAVPDGARMTDPDVMDPYGRDRAETVVPGPPVAVVRATSVADVPAVLRVASAPALDPHGSLDPGKWV